MHPLINPLQILSILHIHARVLNYVMRCNELYKYTTSSMVAIPLCDLATRCLHGRMHIRRAACALSVKGCSAGAWAYTLYVSLSMSY